MFSSILKSRILVAPSARPSLERFGEDHASKHCVKKWIDLENMGAARILLIRIELSTHILAIFILLYYNYTHNTVLHFISEMVSPWFLPQNQIKFLSVKMLFLWLTAFCLAIDNLETRNWKFSTCCLFSDHAFVILKSHQWPA